jgi:thiosulfate/3-mercaptopyruvate sulfurtransferase
VRALVTRAGIDPSRPVITYCLSGVRAAEAWAALSSAGIPARSYEGSFREWVAHPELPVAGPAK